MTLLPRRRLVAALLLATLSPLCAVAETRTPLPQSVGAMRPEVAATARALTPKDRAGRMAVNVALKMRNFEELQARVARGETFSHEELERVYLPLPADYKAIKSWAASQGLAVGRDDPNRLSVFMSGTVDQVQTSFQVSMVKVTSEGVDYPAANTQPSLPASMADAVLGVNGLHPYRHLHKHLKRLPARVQGLEPQAVPTNGYTVPEILTAFDGTNLGVTGAGQTIAILIDATPLTSDLAGFYAANGLPASTVNNVTTINVNNKDVSGREGEETLDVEWTSGMAPGAKIRVYATGDLDDASTDRGLARILADVGANPSIQQLSISLGLGETYSSTSQFTTDAQYFAALASQGVSTFVSSGDGGSTPDSAGSTTGPLQVEYYASDPSVTAVGGTSLTVDANFNYSSETVWNNIDKKTANYDPGGTGGGVSIIFNRPSFQTATGVPVGGKRFVPDVSLPADPFTGAYLYYDGSASPIGGTSWSAPTWAGFCALINQKRGAGMGIGLLNPSVYPLVGTSNFHDITTGNNILNTTNANGNYVATVDYDECTGAGSPDFRVLMNTLVAGTTAAAKPTISGISPSTASVGSPVIITGTNLQNAESVAFYSSPDHDGAATFTINSSTQITATVPPAAENGPLTVTIPGGTATGSTSFTVKTTSSTPTLTSFSPTTGKAGYITVNANTGEETITNGTTITLTGTNFTGATKVTFNGVSGEDYDTPFTVNSSTSISVLVPVDATSGFIKVTTPNGKAISSNSFTVSARTGSPVISSFTPTTGPVGTSVAITGSTLSAVTGVSFGTISTASFTINSSTKITVAVPAGALSGPISVVNAKGGAVSTASFTVTGAAPTISGFNPTSGKVGSSITINGSGFTGASAVTFNGTSTGTFTIVSDTQITATVPAGASSGVIGVTTSNGSGTSSGTFTVLPNAPTVSNFSPSSGPVGTSVIITGTGFTNATGVSFNGTAATSYTVNSDTQITVPVPGGATTGAISVSNAGGAATSSNAFTVTVLAPDLTVGLTHAGAFTQADSADTYTITVTNSGNASTAGTVSVTDSLPTGLSATAISGSGWTTDLGSLTCTRTDALSGGASYPAITLTVSVAMNAPSSVTNSVTVSGGGETVTTNDTANDQTAIAALTPSQSWRDTYFGTTSNSGNAADLATPTYDGLPNIVKYALGLDPRYPEGSPISSDVSTGYLRLSTQINAQAADVTVSAQATGTPDVPASWSSNGLTFDNSVPNELRVSDSVLINAGGPRFLRLVVTRP